MQVDLAQVEVIFGEAVTKADVAARAAYVESACGDNAQLRERVEALLAAHEAAGSFLALPEEDSETTPFVAVIEGPGMAIGRYKLLEQIGEGGFGVVFMAEQGAPVRRRVALKIIKLGMDTRQVVARFEAERQALAMMDHPNIAMVLDAGATDAGRPYFVMELIRGTPITKYCDAQQLSISARLTLFIQVCQAVQHAHQKGIIHRDLKPSNVLVTMHDDKPVPKIIDFGVAKAIDGKLTERTLFTGFHQLIGTPAYMSPEQAQLSGIDVDTRSDVYSLGVLLYELLTGTTPFDSKSLLAAPLDEMRRIVREVEPPSPSTRVSTLAADSRTIKAIDRKIDPQRLGPTLRGDLDWIVMRCLEKDRTRRYPTASALALDVQRHLDDEPVEAHRPTELYRLKKYIRRNRLTVITCGAVLLGLVVGIVGMTIALISQSRQRAIAERERAEVQLNYAVALQSQRKYAEAEALYRQGLEIPTGDTPEDRQRAARIRSRLAEVVTDRNGVAASEQLHQEALEAYRMAFPPGDPNIAHALTNFALVLRGLSRFAEAEPLFREAYEIHHQAIPVDHRAIGESAANLANVLITMEKYAEAEPVAREAIAEHRLAVPQDTWALAMARLELGRNLLSMGRFAEAESVLLEAEPVLAKTVNFHFGPFSLVALYTKWDQAAPGQGYEAHAEHWLNTLIGTFAPPTAAKVEAVDSTPTSQE